ncbi:bifunctional UDP-N-acetylglucosamine diphosphorylase/glucosamine-1-phosphate N-acetyltransferase GlmU [Sulfurovum sp. NBC37-1]|uniref:Bifunctional protein GlmU n=1 Tax=Sulfurovum sp. (strain NBC37-1) TaxID=387093 RepID=GLMU_SULNB|nr:bifunctional UDP-N-acetylglucosamine diphosphorylase/glucosamine-1-phosphate N-acetyltransferase GlmU [Sulfurovum sp. NBC37-1]A6QBC4.1 RecName: Full=Bifunctional protein GlmU; Includes: RecName: Full=UDP-N-acetylglucosamine pyrophosphorylase; AltName: Full=N-acetylglucosamine-1-phosphate uridyltransferase; Includes: RecName: Full=Glucosamine-1-phosphate N-acetyltransferase [Sulfurovum sp. NBC37-1]BAF72783.1 glucosamine-1-phosphate N-acetyltransferase/UDP-N-acetylglucosamine pyrophosphorylase [
MSISVVILAAGQGTRMKSSTPKVLHTISGKPMLFHAIDAAKEISDDITVILHHQEERIQKEVEAEYENIIFHRQDAKNFPGTGGAMKGVYTRHERTLILNGDMPLIKKSSLEALTSGDADINMSIIRLEDPSGYGRVIIEDDKVVEIVEQKDCNEAQLCTQTVNAGIYAVDTALLERYIPLLRNDNAQKEYYLTDIVKMAVDEGRTVHPVYVEEEEFKGVNSKLDLARAEEIMQRRIKEALMMAGVTMCLPETIYIDCRATFEGECELENGVRIQGAAQLVNTHIKAHSVIEDSYLKNSDVGPMGRVRPGSKLVDTHIGNFVEVKKSDLNGVKAGHLSYIGDAQIGEGSNIGAGVITCNYDGKNKFRTIIGKNVFVGSDTQLVAPVCIEDDVIIAAGTTVNKDVEKGVLAISRTPMRTVKNFFYKFFGDK